MWVTPGSRKEGIALLLAEAVFEWAKEDGADTVTLYVGPDNTGARAVYDSLGFEDTGDRWVVVEDDRSEEHTSELQSRGHLVCRLLLEKKKSHQQSLRSRSPRRW